MISRRDLIKYSAQAYMASHLPLSPKDAAERSVRCINVVNFMRGVEPRGPVDLMLPVRKQMEILLAEKLPATWLLQYDALVSGPFVDFLKSHVARDHEVGVWFEMNEMHCKAADVEWRGRPGYEWDHYPSVAFTIGYTEPERVRLADAFMSEFKRVWGRYPSSVASWNLDAITMAHLTKHYGINAYAVCRDQIATDGFTIWGAPIAGYYPSKKNCWSPALSRKEQIETPVLRMLGQDPVYYYESRYPLPDGRRPGGPDTMEPVWPSGRSPEFIQNFLDMIAKAPTLGFAYTQLGQENNFGWPEMADAYPRQMRALAQLRDDGVIHVETMGETGRRFKRAFRQTPPQAQIMLKDPFGNAPRSERSVWYQSRFYRANLHLKGDLPYLRDLTVYSDTNPQPFLTEATRLHDVEQRMPAVLDGYHWSKNPGSPDPGAGGYFLIEGRRARLAGEPKVREEGRALKVDLPIEGGRTLRIRFEEKRLTVSVEPPAPFAISFEWEPTKSALVRLAGNRAEYRWQGFEYSVDVQGELQATSTGWLARSSNGREVSLRLAQPT